MRKSTDGGYRWCRGRWVDIHLTSGIHLPKGVLGRCQGQHTEIILLHHQHFFLKRLTVGAHSETCTQQERTEGKWETAAEAWWGELPLLVRSVTWQQRGQVRGEYSRYKRMREKYTRGWGARGLREWTGGERERGTLGWRERGSPALLIRLPRESFTSFSLCWLPPPNAVFMPSCLFPTLSSSFSFLSYF